MKTLRDRRDEREKEAEEPFRQAEHFAASVKEYLAHEKLPRSVRCTLAHVEIGDGSDGGHISMVALGHDKWFCDGKLFEHDAMLDKVLAYLGWDNDGPLGAPPARS